MEHNRKIIEVLSTARALSKPEDRLLVKKILEEHAISCRICSRYIFREGWRDVWAFRDYLEREWVASDLLNLTQEKENKVK